MVYECPERPTDGSPEQLLHHAVRYGTYCQKLETDATHENLTGKTKINRSENSFTL